MDRKDVISLKDFGYTVSSSYSVRDIAIKLAVKCFSVSEIIDHMFILGEYQEHILDDCQEFLGQYFTLEQNKKFGTLKREFGFAEGMKIQNRKKITCNNVYDKQKIYGYGLNLDPEFTMT